MEDWLKSALAERIFDFILYIDIRKGVYRRCCGSKELPYFLPDEGSYEFFLDRMGTMLCGDRKAFSEHMKLIRVLGVLEERKKYAVFYSLQIQERIYDEKMVFFYGQEKDLLIAACEDITGMTGGKEKEARENRHGADVRDEEIEQLKEQTAALAHETRISLHSIYGNLFDLKRDRRFDDVRLDDAFYAAEYLLSLMNSLLDISSLENDTNVTHLEAVTMEELTEYLQKICGQSAQEKGIVLQFHVEKPIYRYLYINKNMVRQIMLNLLSNAVKYTNSGGRIICHITEAYLEEKRVKLFIEVTDTGIGMKEEFLSEAWDAYTRERRMNGSAGSGLGLMLTKRMVELLHGSIDIVSRAGSGTKVSVELEADGDDVVYAQCAPEAEGGSDRQEQLRIRRALVAEDEKSNMEVLCRYLEQLGITAERACNGSEAVEMFEKSETDYYHVALVDIHMPEMGGMEAVLKIRNMDRRDNDLPMIAVTAQTPVRPKKDMLSAAIDGYLVKPYRLEDIRAVLLKCQR